MDATGESTADATAADFRRWAETDAHGRSPLYERLAVELSQDDRVMTLLQLVSSKQRKPALLFGLLRMHGVPIDRPEVAAEWLVDHPQLLLSELRRRRVQTNEVRRAAALMPAVATVAQGGEIALIELGASAGLLLLLDRYQYVYTRPEGEVRVGDPNSALTLTTAVRGQVPVPSQVPSISRRIGVDINPIDPRDKEERRWLEALVWPEHTGRRERLTAGLGMAAVDPPRVMRGDMAAGLENLLERVPYGTTPVVMHSVALQYLSPEKQDAVVAMCRHARVPRVGLEHSEDNQKQLALTIDMGRARVVATVQPHGEWIEGV